MGFESTKQARERILAMGAAGSGKTHSWLSIARMSQKRKSDAKFYVLDTDNTVARMLDEEFSELENVEFRLTYDWPEYMDGVQEYRSKAKRDDWIVVDMLSPAWDTVQEHYVDQVFKKGVDEFFLAARAAGDKAALDGWRDWGVINKMYRQFTNNLLRIPCHFFACTSVDTISDRDENEDKSNRLLFGPYGVKPRGQKHTAHIVHTVLLMANRRDKRDLVWTTTSVKDRGRRLLVSEQMNDFAIGYLIKCGGWKLA